MKTYPLCYPKSPWPHFQPTYRPVLDGLPELDERPVGVVDHLVPVAGVQPLEGVPHQHELEEAPLRPLQFRPTLQ